MADHHVPDYVRRENVLQRIFKDGTAWEPSGPVQSISDAAFQLFPYQNEAVARMREFEVRGRVVVNESDARMKKRKATQSLLCNFGILSEPPCSGNTSICVAHVKASPPIDVERSEYLAQAREDEKRRQLEESMESCGTASFRTVTRLDDSEPSEAGRTYVPMNVAIVHPKAMESWRKITAVMAVKSLCVSSNRQYDAGIGDKTPEAIAAEYDLVVIHSAYAYRVAHFLDKVRVMRLFLDWGGILDVRFIDVKAAFVWIVDANPYNLLTYGDRYGPTKRDQGVKNQGMVTQIVCPALTWVLDPSAFVIRHPVSRIHAEAAVLPPATGIYRCSPRYLENAPLNLVGEDMPEEERVRRLVIESDASGVTMEDAVRECTTEAERERLKESAESECPICYSDTRAPDVVLKCCRRMICQVCALNLVSRKCPFDQRPLYDERRCLISVIGAKKPANVVHVYQDQLSRIIAGVHTKSRWLTTIVSQLPERTRAVIFISEPDMRNFGDGFDITTFLARMGFYTERLRWHLQSAPKACDRLGSPYYPAALANKRALIVHPGSNLSGCSFQHATDIVFCTRPTDEEYENVMLRTRDLANATLERKDNLRLRVHMLVAQNETVPQSLEMYKDRAEDREYASKIKEDIARFNGAQAGLPRFLIMP